MKKVFLKQLRLTNFKGIRDLTIAFGGNTNIFGQNRAGKSTVADAFTWLLWSKDQMGREDYEIKTLDDNNEPLHKLDHEVEAVFVIDGKEETVRKVYREIWTKKRGEPAATFTGHEKVYFWNDVPMKMAEYNTKIGGIINEGMFKLITNPLYFNSLHWEKRRACLLDIAGEIKDNEIFDKIATPKNDYGNLINVLNSGKTTLEYKKEIGAKKNRIKKELEDIPSRIDEADRSKPESFDFESIFSQIAEKATSIQDVEDQLTDTVKAQAATQKALTDRQTNFHNLKTQLSSIRFRIETEIQSEQNSGKSNIANAESALRNLKQSIELKQQTLNARVSAKETILQSLAENDVRLNQLREDWAKIDAEVFKFDDTACVCPTCKQMLQQNDIEVKKQELLGNFNTDKLERLNAKVKQASAVKESTEQLKKTITSLDTQINELENEIKQLDSQMPSLKTKLDTYKIVEDNRASFDLAAAVEERLKKDTDAINLRVQIKGIEDEIINPASTPQVIDTSLLRTQKMTLQAELTALRDKYANKATIERTNARITELHRMEENLSQELAGYEQQEFEIMNYEKARMDILESRINSRFSWVSFKMFNRNINGGEEPACECLYKGVPYPTLNTEAKINCGIDIINVLCDHYRVSAPIFIDNRESVSSIIPTDSQVINLIVNPDCPTLTVQAA